jgi:hypothetical protein
LGTTAGLHADQTRLAVCKMLEEYGTFQLPVCDLTCVSIEPMKLDDVFGDIDTDRRILISDPPVSL